jgi:hypothetical protein
MGFGRCLQGQTDWKKREAQGKDTGHIWLHQSRCINAKEMK